MCAWNMEFVLPLESDKEGFLCIDWSNTMVEKLNVGSKDVPFRHIGNKHGSLWVWSMGLMGIPKVHLVQRVWKCSQVFAYEVS